MKLNAKLVNCPWEDPALFCETGGAQAVLFDCGNLANLRIRDLMRLTHVFITHTHIDHFIGFDTVVRMNLRNQTTITFYGPEGLSQQIAGHLQGYTWNLTEDSQLVIKCCELGNETATISVFPCADKFRLSEQSRFKHQGCLALHLDDKANSPAAQLSFTPVIHRVPCLAYSLCEPDAWNVDSQALKTSGLKTGAWVSQLKDWAENPQDDMLINTEAGPLSAQQLCQQLLVKKPGRRLTYVSDSIFNKESVKALRHLATNSNELWCEACFRHDLLELARQNYHFTAKQTGKLAQEVKAEALYLFHYSRRYRGDLNGHIAEAQSVFPYCAIPPRYQSEKAEN